jgi:hypothetical protein
LLLLLAGGAITYIFHKPNLKASIDKKRLIAIVCLILAIWVVIEFTLAKGIIYPLIRNLPVFSSLRANVRYISAFVFPLAFVGAVIFDNWTKNWKSKAKILAVFLLLDGIALGALATYHWVPTKYAVVAGYQLNQCDFRPILSTYEKIRYEGETFQIKNVVPDDDPWMVFQDNATNLVDPYNAYFKSLTGYRDALHAGSVYDVDNGYYNIINPTGYLFPEANHSTKYERMAVTDQAKFLDFINRRQPKWKLPLLQQVLDWVSPLALVAVFIALLAQVLKKWIRFPQIMVPLRKNNSR